MSGGIRSGLRFAPMPRFALLPGFALAMLLLCAGCSTVDRDAANFRQSQKLRQQALKADSQGDTATALQNLNQVQVLEPLADRTTGVPARLDHPEHRAIAPASGSTTCNNIGINRFFCF